MGGQQPDLGLFPTIDSLREWITKAKLSMSAEMGTNFDGVKEHDHQVSMRDGGRITCRVYQPENPPSDGSPLAVIYHGGQFFPQREGFAENRYAILAYAKDYVEPAICHEPARHMLTCLVRPLGGWCIGGLENEELLCRLLTSKLGITSVNVDYRLSPEYKFPVPVHDCHDATKWVRW